MQMPFDPDLLSLRPVHTKCVAGALFVCLADSPPEFGGFAAALEPLLAAHDMRHTRVAAQSTEIWHANWKLVMENARECYHCMAGHPDLCVTLPVKRRSLPLAEQFRITAPFTERMAERGLPVGPDQGPWWQVARYPLNIGAVSLSLDGQPPVSRPMGRLGDGDVGTLRWSIDPHCFVHAVGDHVFMFSAMPTGPHQTLVTSKWLVHENAVEGTEYQLDVLTALWTRTNDQDRSLVEINQAGVNSLGYVPGPYCATAEQFLVRFVDWYCQTAALFIQERRQSPGRQAA
jgi:Rieske 2Fe-2S family protein